MSQTTLTSGVFSNGMAFAKWGDGDKVALAIPGGPGNEIPSGIGLRLSLRPLKPLIDSGYAIWLVARRQGMPAGHSVEDMAADYADLIRDEFNGKVEVVVGSSYGGIIAQYLAANHEDTFGSVVVVVAACEVSPEGKVLDYEFAKAMSERRTTEAGATMVSGLFPRLPQWLVRPLGALVGRTMTGSHDSFASDILVEGKAEVAFDSRHALPNIRVPVLLIAGTDDMYFPLEVIEETAELIPDCTLRLYEGKSHVAAASDSRIASDILEFINRPQS